MTLCGVEFEDPREFPIPKRDYREYQEGVRTSVKEMWVCAYENCGNAVCMAKHQITMTNRGVCTFDGRQLRDDDEKKLVAALFGQVKFV